MSYSLDLRKRVVEYIKNGGSVTKASQIYQVGRTTIYQWLKRDNLSPTRVVRRHRKLDWEALKKDVKENPDARLIDRAQKFNVTINAIFYALKKMNITRKKKNIVIKKEKQN